MSSKSWFSICSIGFICTLVTVSGGNVARISGGNVVQAQEFPFIASVQVKNRFDVFVHICGGSILSSKVVITAAHCFQNQKRTLDAYRVYVGNGEEFKITTISTHPFYNSISLKNDLAIVELANSIIFSNAVVPVQLYRGALEDCARVITAGWGAKKNDDVPLKIIELKTFSNNKCRSQMNEIMTKPQLVHNSVVCALAIEKGVGIDNGDSGGPLIYNNALIGVTSWTFGVGFPIGFQRIHAFADWIDEILASEL